MYQNPRRGRGGDKTASLADTYYTVTLRMTPRRGTADADIKATHPHPPLVGAHGYHRFPLSKPVVGPNIALHAVSAYRATAYLV